MQQQSVLQARVSGLCEPPNQEVWTTANKFDLSDDKVSELPQSADCPSLIALYLQGDSELTAIPPLFFQRMALLRVLDLSNTSIKSLPKSLPKLVAIKTLLLRGCQLFMELSPQVGELENLEQLDLDKTQIMDLPREIGKLVSLRHLRVSFYPICGNKKLKSNIVVHPGTISNLSQLTDLYIDVDPADKRWDDSVEVVVKEVCNSKIRLRTLSLYLPKFQLLEYMSSIYPSLSHFRFIVGHIKRRIISRVPQEAEAEFRNWDKCLKFVNGENIPTAIKGLLKYCNSFFLDHHATAMDLSEFGIENMKRLKCCLLAECNQMETIIDGERHSEGSKDDGSKSDSSCVENVMLESLEYLNIYYMENLGSIWRGPSLYGCLSKLKFLALHTCPRLINVFSHTLLGNLVNLEELILEDCPLVTSLVSHPSVEPKMTDEFLPRLKRLLLLYLPALVSISNGLRIAPKLESIGFYNCPNLKSISKTELSSKTLMIIKGERRWWEDMKWNEIEWGNGTDEYLMHIFSPINSNEEDVMTQLAEDRVLFEATIRNEGQYQLDDEKLLQVPTQDHKCQWPEDKEDSIIGTDLTKSTSSTLQQECCSSSDKNKSLEVEDVKFSLPSEISEVDDDERGERVAFPTTSEFEVVDDGYKWRKYRKKAVKLKRIFSRIDKSYYKCVATGCPVKKKVERESEDGRVLNAIYKGSHNHPKPYVEGSDNWLSRGCYDGKAKNLDAAAEATEIINKPTKGGEKGFEDRGKSSLQEKVTYSVLDDGNAFGCWPVLKRSVRKSSASASPDSANVSIPLTRLVYDAATEKRHLNSSNKELCPPNEAHLSSDNPDPPPSYNKSPCQLHQFTFQELKSATHNFRPDSTLGEGAFGYVFKGWIEEDGPAPAKPGSGISVAVKILKPGGVQGHREWMAEVNFLGGLHHPNLVKLIGYCIEDHLRLLVYEFMTRGSLENNLFRRRIPLPWSNRIKIALGAAKGLAFLHGGPEPVLCGDFRTSSILLDSEYNAKLSDFGLATAVPPTRVGTYGYDAPEYVMKGHLTCKSVVYGFGVVLLEILTGRRSLDKQRPSGEQNLVAWARPYLADKRKLYQLVDPRLELNYSLEGVQKVSQLAISCLHRDPKSRPTMDEVAKLLTPLQDH